jgi:Protein of unknown function (DUF2934)
LPSNTLHHYWALNELAIRRKFQKKDAKIPASSSRVFNSPTATAKGGTMPSPAKTMSISGRTAAEADREEQIRMRAYELYEARGGEDGLDVEDWLEAEAEINGRTERIAA